MGALRLLELQIGNRQHHLSVRGRPNGLRTIQKRKTLLDVAALYVKLTGHHQIVITSGRGINHLHQHALGIINPAHALVGLRQTAESIQVVVLNLEPLLVGLFRPWVLASKHRSVAKQEPETRILGRGFCGALRGSGRRRCVSVLQVILGGTGVSTHFNTCAPAHVLAGVLLALSI